LKETEEFWEELFLSLDEAEKKLVKLAPILLKCSKEDAYTVGALVWSHFVNNDEWNGTFRITGRVIAEILNKRFATRKWSYTHFYCSNLIFWNSKTRTSTILQEEKRMEKKYASKICINCS